MERSYFLDNPVELTTPVLAAASTYIDFPDRHKNS